jgi:hypothetical protein
LFDGLLPRQADVGTQAIIEFEKLPPLASLLAAATGRYGRSPPQAPPNPANGFEADISYLVVQAVLPQDMSHLRNGARQLLAA